ncbi:hypothetical protein E3T26_06170 [Cryobacterium sp. TMT1-21]|uniref:hypothetical protein n=1 Tax=Cryobacterium TaxID=69578 RepID=UPI00106D25B2|nr:MULTISPECIES: hypothetical protein [Cryobacterium]TFD14529.1 hypothetical protein E3T42_11795 [Cryobacterium sp. TMT4-10]TFD15680.1 hypothetical protein E3T26_06170 [Cryobacterium sp. TMT1-21]TFD18979.1 hypothetical protein E3T32_11420 [Cryobacterium sp. TMT2-23]TFD39403.1 hypothetical protein E3T37_08085 [Cryobacterium sp. TMT2-10]
MAGTKGSTVTRPSSGRAATVTVWVLAALALAVAGAGFATANHIDSVTRAVFSTELQELRGDLSGSGVVAAELSARTDGVAAAMAAAVRAAEEHMSARNELVEGFNRGIDQYNSSGAVDIVQSELPPLIDRYRGSVADLHDWQEQLAAAVDALHGAVP